MARSGSASVARSAHALVTPQRPTPPPGRAGRVRDRARRATSLVVRFKHPLLGLLGLVAFALGVIGFLAVPADSHLADAAYDTLELFAFQYNGPKAPNLALNIGRFLAFGVALYAVALAISSAFRDELHGFRARFQRRHLVVCGLGPGAVLATLDARRAGSRVVAIADGAEGQAVDYCRAAGAIVLKGDPRDAHILRNAGLRRAERVLVMSDDDEQNARIVAAVRSLTLPQRSEREERRVKRDRGGTKLRCVVQIVDHGLAKLLEEASLKTQSDEEIQLEFFNTAWRAAEAMIEAYPPFDASGRVEGERPHILVVGLGDMAGHLVALAALRWHTLGTDETLHVTVIDSHAQRNIDDLQARYPGVRRTCSFTAIVREVADPAFVRPADFQANGPPTLAYVCLSDDTLAITAGLALRRRLRHVPTVVRTTQHPNLAELLEHPGGREPRPQRGLRAFDVLDGVCRCDVLFNGPFERLARAIHRRHQTSRPDETPSAPWDELPPDFRESSRQSAEAVATKLERVGLTIAPLNEWDREPLTLTREQVEEMAIVEHDRWVAERVALGWRLGPTKDVEGRSHPDLVAWAELSEPIRDYDRNLVRDIPAMLADIGYAVIAADEVEA
jgi:hypothetical protein